MAITDIYRTTGKRTGGRSETDQTSKETWYVETDTIHEVESILNEFVQPGSLATVNGVSRKVEALSAAESEDGYSWLVDVSYKTSSTENPLDEPLMISGSQSARQVEIEFNRQGKPILNTAGDPFQEIIFAEDFDDTLQLSYNVATVPFAASQAAKRTVSSTGVLGLGAGTVRYAGMSFQPQVDDIYGLYYSITIGLALANDWKKRLLNQGFRELDDGELKPIKIDGTEVSQPRLLAQNGTALPQDGDPHTIEEDIYGEADYAALFGIPI